ncbi:MAG: nucleotide pyrophosphohydrolase [Candidatus Babeliales bacterium]
MEDRSTTLSELKKIIQEYVSERKWEQFHTPKNLSVKIAIEAAELMEKFEWLDNKESYDEIEKERQEIENELADVIVAALCFANVANIDVSKAIEHKLALNKAKYPVEKSKGKRVKYTKL